MNKVECDQEKETDPCNNNLCISIPHFLQKIKVRQLVIYVGHLESKERLRIQPAQLFNFS